MARKAIQISVEELRSKIEEAIRNHEDYESGNPIS